MAIVGAGMAGAAAAGALREAGVAVRLFDKGRGAGGRMSTRRVSTPVGELVFDHGAQWFTARDPAFAVAVEGWADAGACAPWTGRLLTFRFGAPQPMPAATRWVGCGGMSAIVKAALTGVDIRFGARVEALEGGPGRVAASLRRRRERRAVRRRADRDPR